MVKEIKKNIYVIEVPLPNNPLRLLNSYFVRGTKRSLLIDTGFNSDVCYEALRSGLEEIGADMSKTDVFLTHLHADHSGLSGRIASETSTIYISEIDKVRLEAFYAPDYWDQTDERFRALGFTDQELRDNRDVSPFVKHAPEEGTPFTGIPDGFTLDLGNHVLKAVSTPGHTPGHMCLYEERSRTLFSGDHVLFGITPNIASWAGYEDSLGRYLESLEKIRHYDVETTLSAHRSPTGDFYSRVDELIAHHRARLDEAFDVVKEEEGLTPYEIASRMTWSIRAKDWSDFPLAQKWFAVSEATSHLDYLEIRNMVRTGLDENGQYRYYVREDRSGR